MPPVLIKVEKPSLILFAEIPATVSPPLFCKVHESLSANPRYIPVCYEFSRMLQRTRKSSLCLCTSSAPKAHQGPISVVRVPPAGLRPVDRRSLYLVPFLTGMKPGFYRRESTSALMRGPERLRLERFVESKGFGSPRVHACWRDNRRD